MKNPTALILASVVVISLASVFYRAEASLVLPDAEFEFAAPVSDPTEATAFVATPLVSFGFMANGRVRVRDGGLFRAEFARGKGANVSLSGRAACVHVGIYTSRAGESSEQAATEASEVKLALVQYLQASVPNLLLFKASGCEKAL